MVKSWTEIDAPMFEQEGFIETLLAKTSILSILDKYGVKYSECRTGNFTHRGKCPFHANGDERTASFFVSDENNSFYCYSCNQGGSTIDFIKIHTGKPYYKAVEWLSNDANITSADDDIEGTNRDPEKTILTHIIRAGLMIRERVAKASGTTEYQKWCRWADKRFNKMDEYLDRLDDTQWEVAKRYYDKVADFISKKG